MPATAQARSTEQARSAEQARPTALSHRALAILRAVADGRATVSRSCEPDLFIDGIACCDHPAARELIRTGLFGPVGSAGAALGSLLPAALTDRGDALLRAADAPRPAGQLLAR